MTLRRLIGRSHSKRNRPTRLAGGQMRNRAIERAMHLTPDVAVFQKRLGALPLATYKIGETVLAGGSRTGGVLILKKGKVTIVRGQTPDKHWAGARIQDHSLSREYARLQLVSAQARVHSKCYLPKDPARRA